MAKGKKTKPTLSSDGTVPQELITVSDRERDAHYDFEPDRIASASTSGNTFLFRCKNGICLEVKWLRETMVRFRYAPEGAFERDFSYAVDPAFQPGQPEVTFEETRPDYLLSSSALHCFVYKKDLSVHLADEDGQWLCRDHKGFSARRTILQGKIRLAVSKEHTPFDHYYGLGDKGGDLRLNGRSFENWNTDAFNFGPDTDPLYKTIPFYLGLRDGKAYGIFLDNTTRTRFDFGKSNPEETRFEAAGGELTYYFFYGPSLLDVARQYAELTGKPELPPLWALGFHQSRWSYFPDDRVREIARAFRERNIPCDAIYLDIDYMDGFRCFTWDKAHFPKPKQLLAELKQEGFYPVVMIDPGIKIDPDYPVYRDGMENDVFCYRTDGDLMTGPVWPQECVFPDFTRPDVRAWWGPLYRELYLEHGVAGFWNDMNEPAIFKVTHLTFPDEVRHDYDGRPTNHKKAHNIYGQQMARATYDGLKALDPSRRPFVLTRASYSGGQRHAATWTGDNASTWDHLRLAHFQMMRMGISGYGFCGSDIGGFSGQPEPELMLRWLQMGVFHPFFRIHSIGNNVTGAGLTDPDWVHEQEALHRLDQEPWAFGPEWEALNRQAIEWRYQWLPYLYTAFREWVLHGTPILKPLVFFDQEDPTLWKEQDGVWVGPDVLVFPVLSPGQKTQTIYLPRGEWRDYRTGKSLEGGKTHRISIELDSLPIFVRAGAVLPHHPVRQSTAFATEELILRVYPPKIGNYTSWLYEDAGEGYGYEKGEFCVMKLELHPDRLIFSAEGSFRPGYKKIRVLVPGGQQEELWIDPFPILGKDPFFEFVFQ